MSGFIKCKDIEIYLLMLSSYKLKLRIQRQLLLRAILQKTAKVKEYIVRYFKMCSFKYAITIHKEAWKDIRTQLLRAFFNANVHYMYYAVCMY